MLLNKNTLFKKISQPDLFLNNLIKIVIQYSQIIS